MGLRLENEVDPRAEVRALSARPPTRSVRDHVGYHGIPSKNEILDDSDILNVDITALSVVAVPICDAHPCRRTNRHLPTPAPFASKLAVAPPPKYRTA